MDSDQGKLFIGGISWETSEEKLSEYFGKYGEVVQTVIMRDKITGRPRGFGFVVFADPSILDMVLQDKHMIDGRTVEAKRALSRDEQHSSVRSGNQNAGRNFGGGGNIKTRKIFVGGLPPTLTDEGFRQYFESFGVITDVVIMHDQSTQRPRGFGFISFDSEEAVDRVLTKTFHDLDGKSVEVKRALPKDSNLGGGAGAHSAGGGYQSYGNSGSNGGSYDSRYAQPQAGGGGYPYASTGYGPAGGYGYGGANNGYGAYGYPGSSPGFGGPSGPYANPNASTAGGYGPSGGPRGPWGAQAPSAFGSSGYGTGAALTGQSPNSGVAGYGSQGYGYGGYAGNNGSYGANPDAYGAVGGRAGSAPSNNGGASGGDQQGTAYMGSYGGDANGGSWRSDPSQPASYGGGQMGYGSGGGYGGAQPRQSQQ